MPRRWSVKEHGAQRAPLKLKGSWTCLCAVTFRAVLCAKGLAPEKTCTCCRGQAPSYKFCRIAICRFEFIRARISRTKHLYEGACPLRKCAISVGGQAPSYKSCVYALLAKHIQQLVDVALQHAGTAAVEQVPGFRIKVNNLLLAAGRGYRHQLIVHHLFCSHAFTANGGIAIHDEQPIRVGFQDKFVGHRLAMTTNIQLFGRHFHTKDIMDQAETGTNRSEE